MRIEFIENMKDFFGGYFWLPCPMCGKMFSGHEKGGDLWLDSMNGKMTCADPECMKKVEEHNSKIDFGTNPPLVIKITLGERK